MEGGHACLFSLLLQLCRDKTCEPGVQSWMTWERRGSSVLLAKLAATACFSQVQALSCQLAALRRRSPLLCMRGHPCQPVQGSQSPPGHPHPAPHIVCRLNAWSHRKEGLVLPNVSNKNCFAVLTKAIGSICREQEKL